MKERCAKCARTPDQAKLTKHHILPRRFFGSPPTAPIAVLCRGCHDQIEEMIPAKDVRAPQFYWAVLFLFLESDRILVYEWATTRRYYVSLRSVPATPQQRLASVHG